MVYNNSQREKQKRNGKTTKESREERARKKIKKKHVDQVSWCVILAKRKINLIENYRDSHEWLTFNLQIQWLPVVITTKQCHIQSKCVAVGFVKCFKCSVMR